MGIVQRIIGGIVIMTMGLTACAQVDDPAAGVAVPAEATATVEATLSSMVTNPEQATSEAAPAAAAPTVTPTPSPQPSPTNTPLPTFTPKPQPSPTLADEPELIEVAGDGSAINVRSGPGTDYSVVAQLAPGAEATVIGRNADESWWKIGLKSPTETGWVYAKIVTFSGDKTEVALAEAPPPPPTATPEAVTEAAPAETEDTPKNPEELESQLRCGKDFCITYQAMVPIWENGGCIGNHSIFVTVLQGPPPGKPLDGIVVGDTFGNIEVASGDKGPGFAEVTLWMNTMSLKVKRHIDGTEYTSEESFPFTAHDELIPAEVLAANGYCDGNIETCRVAQNSNRVCRGHYSWKVTFHKFD